jgi:hypothetical protein
MNKYSVVLTGNYAGIVSVMVYVLGNCIYLWSPRFYAYPVFWVIDPLPTPVFNLRQPSFIGLNYATAHVLSTAQLLEVVDG